MSNTGESSRVHLKTLMVLAFGCLIGAAADRLALGNFFSGVPSLPSLDFPLISEAWSIIQRAYVDRSALKPGAITYGERLMGW